MVKRIKGHLLRRIKLDELSLVDSPANQHARVTLFKRADASAVVDKDYDDPACVVREVQALDFDDVLAEEQAREAGYRVNDAVWRKWQALQESFRTIAADEDVAAADKVTAMQESLRQFIASLSEESEEISEAMSKALDTVPVLAALVEKINHAKDDDPMTAAEKQQLAELQKTVDDLTKKLEAATADDTAQKAAELQGDLDTAKTEKADLEKRLADAEALAKMSDKERKLMEDMDDDGKKKKFMAMSPEERAAEVEKAEKSAADEDPVVYKADDGTEFRKSDDERLVQMAKDRDVDRKEMRKQRERAENAEFAKQAESGFLKHFAGEVDEKVVVLRAVSKIEDEDARKALEKMLEAGGKAISAAFDKIGHQGEDIEALRKTGQAFEKRVAEVQKRDGISHTDAMERAAKEFTDEFEAYQNGGEAVA